MTPFVRHYGAYLGRRRFGAMLMNGDAVPIQNAVAEQGSLALETGQILDTCLDKSVEGLCAGCQSRLCQGLLFRANISIH